MTINNLIQELAKYSKNNSTGELILSNNTVSCQFLFHKGSLLYCSDKFHPARRLKRGNKRWSNWAIESKQLRDDRCWEIQLLEKAINAKQLSLIEAKLIIRAVAQECFFELSCYTDLKSNWKAAEQTISSTLTNLALSSLEIQTIFRRVKQIEEEWVAAGLKNINPSLAPILKEGSSPQHIPVSDKYLNGKFTLWDIASQLGKSVTRVTSSLLPLVEKGILEFQKIPDLSLATADAPVATTPSVSQQSPTKSAQKKPLVACIDDSPVLAHSLSKILRSAGYDILIIQEPMRGFGQIIENKPDLMLLDLNMPNANGYSVCKFLRETPVFEKTPIIILTAQNTRVDRVRAKMVGATDFLGKPPKSEQLLSMIQKYLDC